MIIGATGCHGPRHEMIEMIINNNEIKLLSLLDEGFDLNNPIQDLSHKPTLLHCASQEGNLRFVKILIEEGANPNVLDYVNHSPLDYAILNHHLHIINFFLELGINLTQRLNHLWFDDQEVIRLLFALGARDLHGFQEFAIKDPEKWLNTIDLSLYLKYQGNTLQNRLKHLGIIQFE